MKNIRNKKKHSNHGYGNKMKWRNNLGAWLLMIPAVFILYVLVWRPTVVGFVYSLFQMRGYDIVKFNGLQNYIQVLTHTQFVTILWNTVKYVIWSFIIGFLPPIFIAVMLNEIVHFKNGFRVMIYLPVVIPGISAMLIWYFIYYPDQTGLLNMFLEKLGMEPYTWLNDPNFSIIGIIIFMTWKNFASSMLLYYAALQSVSVEIYEAALIDGAGPLKRFWNVTRPAIEGIILLQAVQQIINIFQIMDQPLAMTGGGPNNSSMTLSLQLFNYGFRSGGTGVGQAMALGAIIFVILMIVTVFYFKLNKKVEDRH